MRKVALHTAAKGQGLSQGESPFISITMGYRILIVGYVLLYDIVTPGLQEILYGSTVPLAEWRFVADLTHRLLLFLPILFYRSDYGLLHPLIFTTTLRLTLGLLHNPGQLLNPFLIFSEPPVYEMKHVALVGWSAEALSRAALKATLISITALAVYYVGFFFGPQPRIPHLVFPNPRNVVPKGLTVVAFSVLTFLVYIRSQGGLNAHMVSWAPGRFEALRGDGPIFVVINAGTVATLVWYALDRKASRSPLFWVVVLFSVPVNFFATGSRSSVVYSILLFFMIWMLRYQRLPTVRIVAAGVVALILVGTLGMLRRSTYKGEVDWAVLSNFDPSSSLSALDEETATSRPDGYLPVIAKVPDEVGFLYGSSYIGTLLFFVPRALWPEKPRGVGAIVAEIIFGGGAGIPLGAVGEVYWNFYIPGVVVVFFLYGLFHQWLARTFTQYHHVPAFWVLYVITLFIFSPGGLETVSYFHHVIPATAILYWMGALSFRKRKMSLYALT
jgi:oligosaccharide repeat unit polymerase